MDVSSAHYSDPTFTVFKVPKWRAYFYQFLSITVWGNLPSNLQRSVSKWYASVYNKPISKYFISPYIKINYTDSNYLEKFKPPFEKCDFECFQDFFIREFKEIPKTGSEWVWPCEGLLCEEGKLHQIQAAQVKCDTRHVATVFGLKEGVIPANYTFTNVFLHNKNYHRIHSPVDGTITRIQHVPGDLVVLRPWIYKQDPSLPAFRNERYNVDITDDLGRTWYLSIVGGPAVGTIELNEKVQCGNSIGKLDQLALFYLGSTCCMAAPRPPQFHKKNTFVAVGMRY